MAGKYLDYYSRVADKLLPFLRGRRVAIEQRFPGSGKIVYRRHAGGPENKSWIQIEDADAIREWARQHAEAFHAYIRADDTSAWFAIDIDSRDLPLEAAQIGAIHAADVLAEQGLAPLVKFSGSDGYHLMWEVPDVTEIDDDALWELERAVVRAVACEVEKRLVDDPRASFIREAVGADRPLITTSSADRENSSALLFDEFILKENANFRVPFSLHPHSGLVAVPVPVSQLASFNSADATPENVAKGWTEIPLPRYSLADVQHAVATWNADGC